MMEYHQNAPTKPRFLTKKKLTSALLYSLLPIMMTRLPGVTLMTMMTPRTWTPPLPTIRPMEFTVSYDCNQFHRSDIVDEKINYTVRISPFRRRVECC
jgi:hypothetical protein